MKFRAILRFEFTYQLRHLSTWLLLTAFFLFGFIILRMVTLTDGAYLNAPGTIAFFTVFGSVIWVVIGGVVAGDIATRDRQTLMHPLTLTTPVTRLEYLGARFTAALFLNILILVALYAGILLSYYGPGAKTEFIGPFRLGSYLTNFGFLALPTVIVTTAIQFGFASLRGRAIASYIASILIIIFSQFGGTTVRYMLEWRMLGGLMDLLGTSIIVEMEAWTPIEMNTRLVALEGPWLWNRLAWLSVAILVLAYTYFRFRFTHSTDALRAWSLLSNHKLLGPVLSPQDIETTSPKYQKHHSGISTSKSDIRPDFSLMAHASQIRAIGWASFTMIARSRGGLILVGMLAIGTGLFATEYMEWLGVPLIARTEEVLRILTPSLSNFRTQWIVIPLLIIFYAGELVWHEREAGLNELSDTTSVPESVLFLGKFVGLVLIIVIWVAFLMMAGIINQLVMYYYHFEISLYIKALFGLQLINYILFAVLVLSIHVVVNQKFIGHMAALCVYGFILYASMIGVEHNLLIYASDPGWAYSDMRGFSPFIKAWLWFKLYWLSWAYFLVILAITMWVRSHEGGFKSRFLLASDRFMRHKTAFIVALGSVAFSGGFIYYNTNVLNVYANKQDRMEMRAEYERRYGKYENTTQPTLTRTNLKVELYPERQEVEILGTYHLVNRSNVEIDSLHISHVPWVRLGNVAFDKTAIAAVVDDDLGYQIYVLNKGLVPGDSIKMSFEVHIKSQGFSNYGVDVSVVRNGSHVTSEDWMPDLGYNEDRRLRDSRDRVKYGLPSRPERVSLYDVEARYKARHAERMDFEVGVGTAGDQIAVAPGALRRTWMKEGRRYFHYATNAPIQNEYSIFSAKYSLHETQWVPPSSSRPICPESGNGPQSSQGPVTIQIYYHPTHSGNVERMMKSARASLEYYSEQFGPYPYSHFRVVERPGPGRGMHAEPMTIDYQEGYSLMNPGPDGLDLPYHIMSHEVAHQWWGLQLSPAAVEGSGLLVESFATYSAMQVVEETLGYQHLLLYLSQMRQEYEVPRSPAAPPLLRSNSAFMNYRKGPFALFALRNYIRKDTVNHALRRMLCTFTSSPPLPTTLDFYRELQAVTPDTLQYLLHDLFAANTFWDLKTELATAKQIDSGKWQVTLQVEARKTIVDSIGVETGIPMNDWIEVGVYALRKDSKSPSKVLYLQKQRIRSGRQTILVQVSEQPARAGIDPNHLMIDYELVDNTKRVKIE